MSFMNIKDPEERDATITGYLQERNLRERSDLMDHQTDLEENFKPVGAIKRWLRRLFKI